MSLPDVIFTFSFGGKKKEYNFFEFDSFDEIRKRIIEDYNLDETMLLTFDFPSQYNQHFQTQKEKLKINQFFDEETFEYFKKLTIELLQEKNFFSKHQKIIINKVSKLPDGLPSLKKHLQKQLEDQLKTLLMKIKVNVQSKLSNENNYYYIENLKNKAFEFVCHKNIICNNCFKTNFIGFRFICTECDRFNLCENCELLKTQLIIEHNPNHLFIQIPTPVNEEMLFYNNIIERKNQLIKVNVGDIKTKNIKPYVIIHNTGENSFKNCTLYPICYGEGYILGDVIKITEDIKKNESIKIDIKLNEFHDSGVSKWRMITENGIPFGEVIYLTLIVDESESKK